MELDKFWTEEISRAIEALKMRRVDPMDSERWNNFHANLKRTIESWKAPVRLLIPVLRITDRSKHLVQNEQPNLCHNDAGSSKVCVSRFDFGIPLD
jgi:Ser/Thr protein kinase RdoA (MazF antagonist)